MGIRYIWVIGFLPAFAGAQPLASLVDEALRSNREILAAQKKYEAARQRPSQAAALPDPALSVGYTSNGGPWPGAGLGSAATSNAGLMISQEMLFPGKRQLRGEIAAKEAEAEFQQYLLVRLSVVSRLKQAYHELHHANVSIEFVKRYQGLLENILRISEARYSVGRAAQQDIFKIQTQFSIFQTQLLRYQQERASKEIAINALLNRRQGGHIDVPMEMEAGEIPASLDEMLAHARAQGPMIAREQKLVERNELAANLARKDYYPDYTVSGGYFNQGSMPPMWQFRVDFKLPAYFWHKQHAAVTEREFTASEARHNYEAADVSIEARIREDYTIAETARKLIDLYRKSVIPEAQLALESSMASYETGKLDFVAVFSNFMNVVDYELMVHEEVMQFHVALARLEEMAGGEMRKLAVVLLIAAAFLGGYGYGRWYGKSLSTPNGTGGRKVLYWVDAMHPWYKSDKPGTAPDCGMKLVPVYEGEGKQVGNALPPGTVQISREKQQLIGLEYGTVQYETVTGSIRAAARVTLDETKIAKVQSKLEGWIDQVFVDFTGKSVKKGDPLLTIYSPEALATQQEYLLAIKAQHLMHDNPMQEMMGSTENLVAAAKKRLELWDITDRQITEIGNTGKTLQNLTLDSPISGFVMERNAFPKQHVTPDTVLYTVADLSTVWVIGDVFEYEAANVKLNAPATLTLAYLPGRVFRGRVSYILPQVDANTRTLKVRMQFDNPGYLLKPEMYGEVEFQTGGARKLVVPQTAVLNSGDRQTVFLDRGNGNFEPREVKVGAQMENRVEILSGLQAGDRIVISGNFLLDSESRLK